MVQIKKRQFWLNKINDLWKKASIIWLHGVRRVGKSCLCLSIPDAEYFDCELPSVRRLFEDPEEFLKARRNRKIIIDEIHRLNNPSEILKIASDYYKDIKIIATGSSTLGSSIKFKDTLTGRKKDLWLVPMVWQDLLDFKMLDLSHRLHRGGLPPFFLATNVIEHEFQEWLDAFWSKDIQELFRLERRYSFQKFIELLFLKSGGIFEATQFSKPSEVSRTTISNYLKVLEATSVVYILKPFSSYSASEIIRAPKVYAFDTGFVSYWRGWDKLRVEDFGILWEHFVLNEIIGNLQTRKIYYWRDKIGHEIDFILTTPEKLPIAIETKWQEESFDPKNLIIFRKKYPKGKNYVVSHNIDKFFIRKYKNISVKFMNISDFAKEISKENL